MANADEVFYELELAYRRRLPGRTADDLAALIYGRRNKAYPQLVEDALRPLLADGQIEKLGKGGQDDPYIYRIPPPQVKRRKL
jgi:hypothetical protein